ncbi:hypothetical protein PsorP6_000870 [Peronosclerospora sorghi]|uniref:Uncharacterized protein n=1 Tax=Peronosclerospora sorghi TaxID=230839 RepID=A0ACC0WV51_9STRA|nr:hypothetical protein PsorP6_000870 [Peronosclerospora sorghi]
MTNLVDIVIEKLVVREEPLHSSIATISKIKKKVPNQLIQNFTGGIKLLVVFSHVVHATAAGMRIVGSSLVRRLWYASRKLSRSSSGIASRYASH